VSTPSLRAAKQPARTGIVGRKSVVEPSSRNVISTSFTPELQSNPYRVLVSAPMQYDTTFNVSQRKSDKNLLHALTDVLRAPLALHNKNRLWTCTHPAKLRKSSSFFSCWHLCSFALLKLRSRLFEIKKHRSKTNRKLDYKSNVAIRQRLFEPVRRERKKSSSRIEPTILPVAVVACRRIDSGSHAFLRLLLSLHIQRRNRAFG
jgi:hypothetical protein